MKPEDIYQHKGLIYKLLREAGIPEGLLEEVSQDVFVAALTNLKSNKKGFAQTTYIRLQVRGVLSLRAQYYKAKGRSAIMESLHKESSEDGSQYVYEPSTKDDTLNQIYIKQLKEKVPNYIAALWTNPLGYANAGKHKTNRGARNKDGSGPKNDMITTIKNISEAYGITHGALRQRVRKWRAQELEALNV